LVHNDHNTLNNFLSKFIPDFKSQSIFCSKFPPYICFCFLSTFFLLHLITCVALRTGKLGKQEKQEEKSDLAQNEKEQTHIEEVEKPKKAKVDEGGKEKDNASKDSKDDDGKIE
jgi:hypothetical protein